MKYEIYVFEAKKTEPFCKKAVAEYEKRLSRYCHAACHFIRKEKEWNKALAACPRGIMVIPGEESPSSEEFSERIRRWEMSGRGKVEFFIPGESETRENKSGEILNLSDFTLSSGLSAMTLTEQIYRGYRIIHNHPYHK